MWVCQNNTTSHQSNVASSNDSEVISEAANDNSNEVPIYETFDDFEEAILKHDDGRRVDNHKRGEDIDILFIDDTSLTLKEKSNIEMAFWKIHG